MVSADWACQRKIRRHHVQPGVTARRRDQVMAAWREVAGEEGGGYMRHRQDSGVRGDRLFDDDRHD
jgi:hypothetical protein